MSSWECVSCKEVFRIQGLGGAPDYCPACGLARNEQFGMKVAESNPNITGFRPPYLEENRDA